MWRGAIQKNNSAGGHQRGASGQSREPTRPPGSAPENQHCGQQDFHQQGNESSARSGKQQRRNRNQNDAADHRRRGLPAQRRQSARHRKRNQHLHQAGVMVVVDVGTKCPTGAFHRPVNQSPGSRRTEKWQKVRAETCTRRESQRRREVDRMSLFCLSTRGDPPRIGLFGT